MTRCTERWVGTDMILVPCLVSVCLMAAPSDAPSVQAEIDRATAVAEGRAGRWQGALTAINHALSVSPDWPEALFLRAGIEQSLAGEESRLDHLTGSAFRPTRPAADYAEMEVNLRAASRDLSRFLELQPGAGSRERIVATLGELNARAAAAHDASTLVAREEKQKADEADRVARQQAEAAASLRRQQMEVEKQRVVEAQLRLAQEREDEMSSRRHWRTAGYVVTGVGGLAGAGAIYAAVETGSTNQRLKAGDYPSGREMGSARSDNLALSTVGRASAVAAAIFVTVGLSTVLTHLEPSSDPATQASIGVTVAPGIALVGFEVPIQ